METQELLKPKQGMDIYELADYIESVYLIKEPQEIYQELLDTRLVDPCPVPVTETCICAMWFLLRRNSSAATSIVNQLRHKGLNQLSDWLFGVLLDFHAR
jgi:hypothetical protein